MIHIGNKRTGSDGYYVGRPSALGNPYLLAASEKAVKLGSHLVHSGPDSRDWCCDQYELWLNHRIQLQDPAVIGELETIRGILKETGSVTLVCWCHPKRCHAEAIKKYLEKDSQTH